ncbi:hypothetical protein ACOME3_010595 [Neoechinorhynchus agilis]
MGCDGGTIPRRDELVRTKKHKPRKDKQALRAARWNNCSLSQLPLKLPVVACRRGRLYNKHELILALIERKDPTVAPNFKNLRHIKKLKRDTRELRLTLNPDFPNDASAVDASDMSVRGMFVFLSGLEMNGSHRFVFLWTCGCVMAARAMKRVQVSKCLVCDRDFDCEDVIAINEDDEENNLANQGDEPSKKRSISTRCELQRCEKTQISPLGHL